ncbi:MAG: protein adenylyltransferase SelO family protein [Caldilineaceae bacterium]
MPWKAAVPAPAVVKINTALAHDLKLDPDALAGAEGAAILAGGIAPAGASPWRKSLCRSSIWRLLTQAGRWACPATGRSDQPGHNGDIHLKGLAARPSPVVATARQSGASFARILMGEAMYALGIPTTRALAATTTGEMIYREGGPQPGAVLARVAASHLRGVAPSNMLPLMRVERKCSTGWITRLPVITPELATTPNPYLGLLRQVCERQARLIAQWMSIGFIHGVMNTDNMAISGETIDYGPCFMDAYDPKTVFSSIDTGGYAMANRHRPVEPGASAEHTAALIDPGCRSRGADCHR